MAPTLLEVAKILALLWAVACCVSAGSGQEASVLNDMLNGKPALPFPANGFYATDVPAHALPLQPSPLQGVFAPEPLLKQAVKLFVGRVIGSESVVVAPSGSLLMLDRYGYVWQADAVPHPAAGQAPYELQDEPLAHLGPGRPLGAALDAAGNLLFCDSYKGLAMLEAESRRVVLLATQVSASSALQPSTDIKYANDLDIAADGTVYFTDCQAIPVAANRLGFWDTFRSYTLGLLSGSYDGRLLRYDPSTGETTVLADGFWYANGVALSEDESFVAVVETNRLRVLRYWLQGPQAGTTDVLISDLPAFPDGIDRAQGGSFWVSLVAPVPPLVQKPFIRSKWVRALAAWLPDSMRPKAAKQGLVLKVSEAGEVQRVLADTEGEHVAFVSAVHEHAGGLFLGNLVGDYVSYLPPQALLQTDVRQ